MTRRWLAIVLGCIVLLAAACGGGDAGPAEPASEDARELVPAMLNEALAVNTADVAVIRCGGDPTCLEDAGGELEDLAQVAISRFESATERLQDECLRGVAGSYLEAFRAEETAGVAAASGDLAGYERSSLSAQDLILTANESLAECGGGSGSDEGIGAEARLAMLQVGRAGQALSVCGDAACIAREAGRMESAAKDAADALRERLPEIPDECARDGLSLFIQALDQGRLGAVAIQEGDDAAAEAALERFTALQQQGAEKVSACIEQG